MRDSERVRDSRLRDWASSVGMVATNTDVERTYDEGRFVALTVQRTDRQKVVLGYFEPGQFIPVHAPDSDVAITVLDGEGIVRDGGKEHAVESGSVVAVPAGEKRGVRADEDTRLAATLVTAPPPTEAEHEPVREGLQRGEFDPE